MKRLDDERAAPLGLQIGAPDDPIAPDEGEHLVAVATLRCKLVHLDHVIEAEHARREPVAPKQVVERRLEDGDTGPWTVQLDARLNDDRRTAVLDGEPLELPFSDEGVDVRPRGLAPPRSSQIGLTCSAIANSVRTPRARTAFTTSALMASCSKRVGASSTSPGSTRSDRS